MKLRVRKIFTAFASRGSLRSRVAFSLAIVRLILVPVFLVAVYYLFAMAWIVDRIVNIDAPAATLAQQASIQMLDARRSERNYFLLRDPAYVTSNHDSVARVEDLLTRIRNLEPAEQAVTQQVRSPLTTYQRQFAAAVSEMAQPGRAPLDRVQSVVRNYERSLDRLVKQNGRRSRAQLMEDLRTQVDSFDSEITATVQTGDPILLQVTNDLENSSRDIASFTSTLEDLNWRHVQNDHRHAQQLLRRAEWVLSIVSALVLVLSVWISFVLPREVVKPLATLKQAVDQAASGNYQIAFEPQGHSELADLTRSIHNLIMQITRLRRTA